MPRTRFPRFHLRSLTLAVRNFVRALAVSAALHLIASPAAADPPRLTFQAGRVEADAALTDVLLEQSVEVRYDRYRVTSDRVRLRVDPDGVSFEGAARLSLCPCPDAPVVFVASGGRFDRTGDLVLRLPRIEVGRVPIFALPWIWLRTPDRPGILPPIIALRSTDGLLLGSGVHLPWRGQDNHLRALDLTAAGYTSGGVQLGASLVTPGSRARVVLDRVHGTRLLLDARGATSAGPAALAYQIDAIRGDRGRSATVDLAPAAQPFDTGAMEASLRTTSGPVSAIAAGALISRAVRGEGAIAAGPRAAFALGGAIARIGSWSADATGTVLGGAAERTGVPLGRAAAGAEIDARPGPVEIRVSTRARARYAGEFDGFTASHEAAVSLRADASLPLVRTFAPKTGEAPLVHWIAPSVSIRGALADVRGPFFAPIEGRVPASSWIAAGGVSTSLGRYAGPALRVDANAGATGDRASAAQALIHARIGADARIAAAAVEAAIVSDRAGDAKAEARGQAVIARTRFGLEDGAWLRIDTAAQRGAGAGQARAIAAGAWAALPGDELAYLAASGVTFGAEISVPWTATVRTSARWDIDLTSGQLLSIRGIAEYRHRCGCLGLALTGAHRAGREGADVALNVDFVPIAAPSRARF